MDDVRHVYFVSHDHLVNITNSLLIRSIFDFFTIHQKRELAYFVVLYCANVHFNETRLYFLLRKAFRHVCKHDNLHEYIFVFVKRLISTDLSIGVLSKDAYFSLIVSDCRRKKTYTTTKSSIYHSCFSTNCVCDLRTFIMLLKPIINIFI